MSGKAALILKLDDHKTREMFRQKAFKQITLTVSTLTGFTLLTISFIDAVRDFIPGTRFDGMIIVNQLAMLIALAALSFRIVAGSWNNFWNPKNLDLREIYQRQFPQASNSSILLYRVFTRSAARTAIVLGSSALLGIIEYLYRFGEGTCVEDGCFTAPGFLPLYVYSAWTCLAIITLRLVAANAAIKDMHE